MIDSSEIKELNCTNLKELAHIVKIHNEIPALWVEDFIINQDEIEEDKKRLRSKIQSKIVICFFIKDNDDIISFIWAEISELSTEILEIISLWTNIRYRNNGFATLLKNHLEKWARKQNKLKKIRSTVSTKNQTMFKLNKDLDYKVTSYNMTKEIK